MQMTPLPDWLLLKCSGKVRRDVQPQGRGILVTRFDIGDGVGFFPAARRVDFIIRGAAGALKYSTVSSTRRLFRMPAVSISR